jgi:hypothetical protein
MRTMEIARAQALYFAAPQPRAAQAPPQDRTLWAGFANWPVTLLTAAQMWVFSCVLVLLIAGGDADRLWRGNGLEMAVMAVSALVYAAVMRWSLRFAHSDPRVPSAVGWIVFVAAVFILAGALIRPLLPAGWVYQGRTGPITAMNGWFLIAFFGSLANLITIVARDARLSAMEPGRDARMRVRDASALAQKRAIAAESSNMLRRAFEWLKRACSWREPVDIGTRMLDVFTVPRAVLRMYIDSLVIGLVLSILVGLFAAASVFPAGFDANKWMEKSVETVPWYFSWITGVLVFGAGNLSLALMKRIAPWLNHSVTASALLVVAAQLGAAALAVSSATWAGGPVLDPFWKGYTWVVAVVFIFPAVLRLNDRAELIDLAAQGREEKLAAAAEAQRAAALADLKALQSQIEPHFLYNTLANLQILIRQDARPDASRADSMAGHLIDYLRARLPIMRALSVSLQQELDMVSAYLAILKIRMGARLEYSVAVPADAAAMHVPPLSVLTMVENSIQHGLEPKRGGGRVDVVARLEGGDLVIEVRDTGLGFSQPSGHVSAKQGSKGVGLSNIKERLRLMYADAASVELTERRDSQGALEGASATLTVPARSEGVESKPFEGRA